MSYRQDLSYQGGPYNEIFSSQGSSNNQTWSIPKTVSRVYEKESKGFCYSLQNSQKLLFPLNKKPANLVHPFLILQIFCSLGNLINIELSTSDMQLNKRRFIFSSHIKDIKVTPLHVMLPVSFIKHGVWINLCIDLHHLVSSCFKNTTFKSLDSIQINGVFKLRKIFTLKDSITDTSGDFDTFGLHIVDVPKALSFSHGVEFINQLVDFNPPKQISPTKTTIAFGRRTGILETNADTRVSRPRTLSSLNKSDKVKVSTRLNVQSTPVETLKIEPIKRPIEPPSVDYDYVDNEADSVNNIIVRDEIIDYSPEINTAELHVDPEFLADEEVEFNQEFCSSHQEAEESEFPVNTSFEYERILRSRKSSLENNVSLPIDEDSHFKQLQDGIKTFFNKQEETDNDDECSSQDEFETEFKMVDSESLQPAIVDGKVYRPTSKLARFSYTADSIEEKVEDDLIEEDSYDLTRDAHELNEFIRTHSRPFSVEHQEVAQEDVLKDAEDASELERHDTAIALNDDGIGKANLNSKDLGEILAQSLKDLREMGNTLRYEQMEEEDL